MLLKFRSLFLNFHRQSAKFQHSVMSSQSKISTFFSRSRSSKRSLSDQSSDEKTSPKKKKLDNKQKGKKETLSPEQKKRIDKNKAAAVEKLKTRRLSQEPADFKDLIGKSWYKALEPEFTKPYFTKLCDFVEKERSTETVYPPSHQVYSWTNFSPIDEVKVVILGQDPYHGPKQAHGLCFSVQEGVKSPPSLVNMYKELDNDIPGFQIPKHGTLNGWAEQGVLLLNACLTVRASKPNSHAGKGWEKLTDSVIAWINENTTGVVFMLWGAYAQKKGAHINSKNHCILKSVHPSPLSAHRGFLGCKHFSECNKYLKQQGREPIDWTKLPPS